MTAKPGVAQPTTEAEAAVYERYAAAAAKVQPALCCPVEYSEQLLEPIPEEILTSSVFGFRDSFVMRCSSFPWKDS